LILVNDGQVMQAMSGEAISDLARSDERTGFVIEHEGKTFRLRAHGKWTIREIARLQGEIERVIMPSTLFAELSGEIDLSGVGRLDIAGAWLVVSTRKDWSARGLETSVVAASMEHDILIREVTNSDAAGQPRESVKSPFRHFLEDIVRGVEGLGRDAAMIIGFLGAVAASFLNVLLHPRRMRWTALVHQLEHVGFRAIGIISLICFLIGAVILQQGVVQLRYYGAEPLAVNMLGVLTLREVGVLLTAIMVAGRSGSAFTAEIGSMKMREEIDAMRTIGIDPLEVLVLPRILALMLVTPLLVFIGNLMCFAGGGMMASVYLGLDWPAYIDNLHGAMEMRHFLAGMLKAPFAALIIGLVGCLEGFKVEGNAESLGFHVTVAVVKAIFLVIIFDAVFAMFLAAIGF
jgi:phospholipid/cholesterol/gamma-HCH transport system permease protein